MTHVSPLAHTQHTQVVVSLITCAEDVQADSDEEGTEDDRRKEGEGSP